MHLGFFYDNRCMKGGCRIEGILLRFALSLGLNKSVNGGIGIVCPAYRIRVACQVRRPRAGRDRVIGGRRIRRVGNSGKRNCDVQEIYIAQAGNFKRARVFSTF